MSRGIVPEGACISAAIFTRVMTRSEPCESSLLAHNVHENVSPTYADPNAGGRVSFNRINAGQRCMYTRLVGLTIGFRSESSWITFGRSSARFSSKCDVDEGGGSGKCWARDGRDRLHKGQDYLMVYDCTSWLTVGLLPF